MSKNPARRSTSGSIKFNSPVALEFVTRPTVVLPGGEPPRPPTRFASLIAGSLRRSATCVFTTGALAACGTSAGSSAENPDVAAAALSTRNNLIKNATFDDGVSLPWTVAFTDPAKGFAKVDEAALCLHVEHAGSNPFDAQFRHREMVIQKGHEYQVQ